MDRLNFRISELSHELSNNFPTRYFIEIYGFAEIDITQSGNVWFKFQYGLSDEFIEKGFKTIKYIVDNKLLNHIYKEFKLKKLYLQLDRTRYHHTQTTLKLIEYLSNTKFDSSNKVVIYDLIKNKFTIEL